MKPPVRPKHLPQFCRVTKVQRLCEPFLRFCAIREDRKLKRG